jgi:hypothetical protein
MKLFESLTPKNILMNAIKDKLEGTGIVKIVMLFSVETDMYNFMLSNRDGSKMKLEITQDEITMIKKMFIRRICTAWNNKYDIEIKNVIVQIDVENSEIEIFIQDKTIKENVHKFDYK